MIGLVFRFSSQAGAWEPRPTGICAPGVSGPPRGAILAGVDWDRGVEEDAREAGFLTATSMARSSDRPRPKVSRGVYLGIGKTKIPKKLAPAQGTPRLESGAKR
uniref:Uncharacterized protein n=1 Tax=Candidatus Kentrum sp. LPFa TaxID=2126335 RepID=A0A450X157_9GAMM|nr:MAG: hypothetical protein BECKLPF1236B_GA0070989_13363 [Candidatus Kentron sp. LPFa]